MSCVEAKMLEVRDRATCITAIAVMVNPAIPEDEAEEFLLGREGIVYPDKFVVLYSFSRNEGKINPYDWGSNTRTMPVIHEELVENWDNYNSGDVIDVRFILGEEEEPCKSDRFYEPKGLI